MEEFVKNNPLHPESAHYVNSLDTSSQREHVVRLIDGAAFFESWEVYFAYALREGVPITDSTITEAVQSVGLDPLSVSLWLQVIRCCPTPAAKREMFHIGLTVPLYGSQALFDEYVAFEDGDGGTPFITRAQYQAVHSVLKSEKWPDRNADVAIHAEKLEVMQQWQELFECMKLEVQEEKIQEEIQMRRIDLAFRQMCVQLQDCDTCWFQYALFLLSAMDDSVGATEIALKGLQQVRGKSLALKSLVSALTGSVDGEDSGASALMKQRMYAMDLSLVDTHSEQMKLFRSVGKAAAQKGYGDWKLYSQWSMTERSLLADPKMAVKVFDNGMKCCSQSVNSSVLLGNEAIEYHLLHRQERETVGRSEQQVELLSSSMHRGRVRASWNSLVRAERELGLHFSSAHSRKLQKFPQSRIVSFLESYRVGDFCPCDDATFSWLEFVGDNDGERGQDAFRQVEPSATKAIAPNFFIDRDCERPEESCWDEFVPMRNEAMSRQVPNGDADEIVGPRDLRGRWVYRVKLDEVTEKRMAREQKKKLVLQQSNIVNDAPDSALTAVVRRVQSLPLSAGQNSCLKAVSVDWVLELLTCDELNLDTILRSKAAVTTVRS